MSDYQSLNIEEVLSIMEEQQTQIENLESKLMEKDSTIANLQKSQNSSEVSKMKSLVEKLNSENKQQASKILSLTDKLEKVNNADLMLSEISQKQKKLYQKEKDIQAQYDRHKAECDKKVIQANIERDNALKKADEISSQCEKDNNAAARYKQEARQELQRYQNLKQNESFYINLTANDMITAFKTDLQAEYDSKVERSKKDFQNRYIANEGYHISLAVISLMIVLYHALWLKSFRTDFLNTFVWIGHRLYDYFSLAVSFVQFFWDFFAGFDNLAATILGGILLNIILTIALFGGLIFGLLRLFIRGWDWFNSKFITKKTGYICLGVLFGIVIFSDVIKSFCPVNLVLILIIINIIIFVVRYFLNDYEE